MEIRRSFSSELPPFLVPSRLGRELPVPWCHICCAGLRLKRLGGGPMGAAEQGGRWPAPPGRSAEMFRPRSHPAPAEVVARFCFLAPTLVACEAGRVENGVTHNQFMLTHVSRKGVTSRTGHPAHQTPRPPCPRCLHVWVRPLLGLLCSSCPVLTAPRPNRELAVGCSGHPALECYVPSHRRIRGPRG